MAKRRAKALTFTGEGKGLYITGVPGRDLSEDEITSLTEMQYLDATEGKEPLYVQAKNASTDEESDDVALTTMTRDELNTLASERGIEEPSGYANKTELIAAIESTGDGGDQE